MESHPPVPFARGVARCRYIESEYFIRISSADVVVITLGLTETWFNALHDLYLNAAPSLWSVRRYTDRFKFERTDVAFNSHALESSYALLRTVSPVPLGTTFTTDDVFVANMYSKSTLRASAQTFAEAHDDVDYFPSYELVMMSRREAAFGHDCLHVGDETVGHVISAFTSTYIGDIRVVDPEFDERRYSEANPDVNEAVRTGPLISGFDHWKTYGRSER